MFYLDFVCLEIALRLFEIFTRNCSHFLGGQFLDGVSSDLLQSMFQAVQAH